MTDNSVEQTEATQQQTDGQNVVDAAQEQESKRDYSDTFARGSKKDDAVNPDQGEAATTEASGDESIEEENVNQETPEPNKAEGAEEGVQPPSADQLKSDLSDMQQRNKDAEDGRAVAKGDLATMTRQTDALLALMKENGIELDEETAKEAGVDLETVNRIKAGQSSDPQTASAPLRDAMVVFDKDFLGENDADGKPTGAKLALDEQFGVDTQEAVQAYGTLVSLDPEEAKRFTTMMRNPSSTARTLKVVKRAIEASKNVGDINGKGGVLGALKRSNAEISRLTSELSAAKGNNTEESSEVSAKDENSHESTPPKGQRPSMSRSKGSTPAGVRSQDYSDVFSGR